MPPARAAKTRKRKQPARARRSGLRGVLPVLEQHHVDLIGLGLVAAGVFLAFPLYLGWDGGTVGEAVADALALLAGVVGLAAPVALVATGALLVLRPVLPAVRPLRAGALCLFAGVTLALAAGTLGLGPDGAREGFWDPEVFRPRGGIAGEALLWVSSTLFSTVGAHILAVFLLAAAVLLLTGATIAGVVRTTSTSIADHTRNLRTPRPRGEA
ncbi:MAG TPA: DNA translocase FtsK 4TM domain-containing protein, partial [Solirubrobacteraceae bacterium]|nr:DNA translocase FtsK 4TM domain-containing protein [Solirubrobacteraceae bacterium]